MTIAGLMLAMVANAQNFVLKGTVKGNVEGCTVMLQKYVRGNEDGWIQGVLIASLWN